MAAQRKMSKDEKTSTTSRSSGGAPRRPPSDASQNVVVITGQVRVEPTLRSTASEEVLLTFDLVSGSEEERRTVPVSWRGPTGLVPKANRGDEVVVLGTVQRRFFRTAGATAHVTDVRADLVARTPAAKQKLMATAVARLAAMYGDRQSSQ